MSSTQLTFDSIDSHRTWLKTQAVLPRGFRVGRASLDFVPSEAPKPSKMTLTLIALDAPSDAFGALFTRNAFPGAPVIVGRERLKERTLGAIVINNKVSNVCAPGGVEASERLSAAAAAALGLSPQEILPCSTGVIGWKLPVEPMVAAMPALAATLSPQSALVAAEGIVTTDLYPKVRRVAVGGGSIVGIAKGAGMVEPNLATMLVFLLTDLDVPRDVLRSSLAVACDHSFNLISVDSDTSTSDTVALVSSKQAGLVSVEEFQKALNQVCADLAEDVVRNGEGVHHVIRVRVRGAKDNAQARRVGKAVVNSPLFECAVAGNDPNVGRLVMAVGKSLGAEDNPFDGSRCTMRMGGRVILDRGIFQLDGGAEMALISHLKSAELYTSVAPSDGLTFQPPIAFPPHEKCVEVEVDLGMGLGEATVLGADRTHEYISENGDYRT